MLHVSGLFLLLSSSRDLSVVAVDLRVCFWSMLDDNEHVTCTCSVNCETMRNLLSVKTFLLLDPSRGVDVVDIYGICIIEALSALMCSGLMETLIGVTTKRTGKLLCILYDAHILWKHLMFICWFYASG